jgi:hypothetical protein
LRAISAELAAQGFLNERGKPFNPKSTSFRVGSTAVHPLLVRHGRSGRIAACGVRLGTKGHTENLSKNTLRYGPEMLGWRLNDRQGAVQNVAQAFSPCPRGDLQPRQHGPLRIGDLGRAISRPVEDGVQVTLSTGHWSAPGACRTSARPHSRSPSEIGKSRGLPASAAYEEAGYRPHRANASSVVTNDHVLQRIAESQDLGAKRTEVTIERLIAELEEARVLANKEGQSLLPWAKRNSLASSSTGKRMARLAISPT